jgi:uncharacterized protein (TIGR00159 family)
LIYLFKIGFLDVSWIDILDIFLVSGLLYQLYKLMRGSVAIRIFLGFLFLYTIYLIVTATQMELLSSILGQFMGVGVLALFILFQQEIRKFLLLIGKSTPFNLEGIFSGFFGGSNLSKNMNVSAIIDACKALGGTNTGALIVISKGSELKFYAESGDDIDASLSKRLLISIFNKYSPLHDGAVIVYKGRIKAARCILPVTENDDLAPNLGLRHRAAIGMTEATDSLVVIVSEETGQISTARNGTLSGNLTPIELRTKIKDYLLEKNVAPEPEPDTVDETVTSSESPASMEKAAG